MKQCPLKIAVCNEDCAWYCPDTKECAIHRIATELIKIEEKNNV